MQGYSKSWGISHFHRDGDMEPENKPGIMAKAGA
jgi:hypothetical protein